jgi:predicted RNA-binding protein YlxR (DUF448 family)
LSARLEDDESGSERTCVATGVKGPPERMLRFALSGEGEVAPDVLRKLPGRGVWTRLSGSAVRQAVAKKAFARGFKTKVLAAPDLADVVDRLLEQDAMRFLSIVNKAGGIVAGAMKVETAIRAGKLAGLIHAADAAADGASKLDRLLKGCLGERAETIARINIFESRQLDLALGRSNVIHAALDAGPASAAFLAKVARLTLYRSDEIVDIGQG